MIGKIIAGYFVWALLGFVHGFHWLCLAPFVFPRGGCVRLGKFGYSAKFIASQILFYWVMEILFWSFREGMQPWYIPCTGGVDMSVKCLFEEQETRYQAFYVIHLVLLLLLIIKYVGDGAVLWWFVRKNERMMSMQRRLGDDGWTDEDETNTG